MSLVKCTVGLRSGFRINFPKSAPSDVSFSENAPSDVTRGRRDYGSTRHSSLGGAAPASPLSQVSTIDKLRYSI